MIIQINCGSSSNSWSQQLFCLLCFHSQSSFFCFFFSLLYVRLTLSAYTLRLTREVHNSDLPVNCLLLLDTYLIPCVEIISGVFLNGKEGLNLYIKRAVTYCISYDNSIVPSIFHYLALSINYLTRIYCGVSNFSTATLEFSSIQGKAKNRPTLNDCLQKLV